MSDLGPGEEDQAQDTRSSQRSAPSVYTIPAHRAFADALAAGVMAQYGRDTMALARGIILLPNNRAVRAVTSAFVRRSDKDGKAGLLLPRLVPIGDIDLDERLGSALDPIGAGVDIPPAIGAMERQMILARLVQQVRASVRQPVDAGEAMRLGQALAATLDQMLVEDIPPSRLAAIDVGTDLSAHWAVSFHLLGIVLDQWPEELAKRGMIDAADRRNRLLHHVAERWSSEPPSGFVIAAGIATTAPAVCAVLKTVSRMANGQLVLSELDQIMEADDWEAIGPFDADPDTGKRKRAHESHPQYAIKLLLDRIGVAREEVALWRWGGGHDARAARSKTISNAMLVPNRTHKWNKIEQEDRSLAGVSALELATPAEEAQAIALILRETMETPDRTAALVTPDRGLALRVAAHLRRWGIEADDSAGQPLAQLPPGTLLLALAQAVAQRFAPVTLLSLAKHPLVRKGEGRKNWLENVRALDLLLRGPRPAQGLGGVDSLLLPRNDGDYDRLALVRSQVAAWWPELRDILAPLEALGHEGQEPAKVFACLRDVASTLTNDTIWAGHQGNEAANLFADIEAALPQGPDQLGIEALPDFIERLLANSTVRPPQGGHPRIAIYGLLEARLQQADVMILAGLNEGTWPALPAPDPWLAPRIRQELGLPGLEHRIGLAAHDFASGLGAPKVIISRARRSGNAPVIASRFWLRLHAMAGKNFASAEQYSQLARMIDKPMSRPERATAPSLLPDAALRPRVVYATDVDRLAADPYSFYAARILRLSRLDMIDADPTYAWRGNAVHKILELWFREDQCNPDTLDHRARQLLHSSGAHPVLRAFWQPRLLKAIEWVGGQVRADALMGRHIELVEAEGQAQIAGVTLKGRADRIDIMPDGSIGIVDYKTGSTPTAKQVKAGYSLQLGLLGIIAEQGGFASLGKRDVSAFEYWSFAKDKNDFGKRIKPAGDKATDKKLGVDQMTEHAAAHFTLAAEKYLTGNAPFEARINPDLPHYTDYDHLMRLEEWFGRGDRDA
jgi:ATP-dependent helicase/nuclease subunit B